MQERFSDRARHAMALANREADRLGHDYLAPGHLMLGLIAEGACVATEALRLFNVNLDAVREEVSAQMKAGDGHSSVGRRAQTAETKQVIADAIEEARKFGHRYVGTEHLVVAMLKNEGSIPGKVLKSHGVKLEDLRERTLGLLRSSIDATHDLAHSRHGDFEWIHQQELSKAFRSAKFWHTMIMAVDSANRYGAGEVEPIHLLLALLRDRENGVTELLEKKGITSDFVREHLVHHSK